MQSSESFNLPQSALTYHRNTLGPGQRTTQNMSTNSVYVGGAQTRPGTSGPLMLMNRSASETSSN